MQSLRSIVVFLAETDWRVTVRYEGIESLIF